MAQTEQTTFVVQAIEKGFDQVVQKLAKVEKAQKKVGNASKKAGRQVDLYGRKMRGAADMSSNATKNFSKMQQGMEGGGSGGLVRAYALLAANVFALSAAFGLFSRAAQVDTLVESMKTLEIVSGQAIRSTARELQEASGFGMDFANSMRSTSLALSAGFESEQIFELGEVARNAAVSLGRNVPDALDRIFRGVIKVEPELLDEIGLFVRVNEAAAKYASSIGVAAGELTEFQKRQAFLEESLEQGRNKFEAFSDVPIDPFAKLATTFADLTQKVLTFLNRAIGPVVNFIIDNESVFAGAFILLGGVLLKMVIPALGQFALRAAANAEQARQDAIEQQQQSLAKIQQLKEQTVALNEITIAENQAAAAAQQRIATENQQTLKVRGRKKSKDLENALKKELNNKGRIQAITQRIADLETKRGLEQRKKKAGFDEELNALKEELRLRTEIAQLEAQSAADVDATPAKGSFAELAAKASAKKMFKADAIGAVAATTELKGFKAGIASISSAVKIYEVNAKAAGISTGFLGKMFLRTGMFATVMGIKIQAALAPIMPLLLPITLLLSFGPAIAKFFGFFSEEQSALSDANKNAAESFDILDEKVKHATESIAKFSEEGNFKGIVDATLALKETTLSTITALDEQVDAFNEYQKETGPIVKGINKFFSGLFGETAQEQITNNTNKLIQQLKVDGNDLTKEMATLVAKLRAAEMADGIFNNTTDEQNELRDQIRERAQVEVEAFKNVKSAIDGARDSARAFSDSLITKTQVDKPLATFKQITASVQDTALSQKEQKLLLDDIVTDNAILSMMTEDQRRALKAAGEDTKARLAVLEQVELSFARQQELLIKQKTELKQLVSLQKMFNKIAKFSADIAEINFEITNKRKKLELEGLQRDFDRKVSATQLTEQRVRQLATMGSLVGREKELGLTTEQITSVQAAVTAMMEVQTFELEEQVRLATEQLDIQKARAQADLKLLNTEVKLNKEKMTATRLSAKLAAFEERGTTKLTPLEELNVIQKEEELRLKTAEKEKKIKMTLAKIDFDIAREQLKVLKERAVLLAKEQEATREERRMNVARSLGIDAMNFDNIDPKVIKGLIDRGFGEELQKFFDLGEIITPDTASIDQSLQDIADAGQNAADAVELSFENAADGIEVKIKELFASTFQGSSAGEDMLGLKRMFDLAKAEDADGNPLFTSEIEQTKIFETTILKFSETMKNVFGEQGALASQLGVFSASMVSIATSFSTTFENAETGAQKVEAIGTAVAASLGQVSQLFSAYNQQQIAEVDALIEAEKKRDGKSAESVAKIAALEKKKENIKRKEFEINKKIQMAQVVASTAAAIAGAFPLLSNPVTAPLGKALIGMIATMGAAQLAIISKLKFNATPSGAGDTTPASLTIGKRSNTVDVSQGATAGELNYLRGGRTTGQGLGGAGGAMGRRGYADGGIVVGERGPEVISPAGSVDITPNFALGGGTQNINFTIQAMDASGVEDVLRNQQGNIIRMIREAANENGERFLETVDTQTYGSST